MHVDKHQLAIVLSCRFCFFNNLSILVNDSFVFGELTNNTQIAAMALFVDFPRQHRLSMKSPICFIFWNIFLLASHFVGLDPMIFCQSLSYKDLIPPYSE